MSAYRLTIIAIDQDIPFTDEYDSLNQAITLSQDFCSMAEINNHTIHSIQITIVE